VVSVQPETVQLESRSGHLCSRANHDHRHDDVDHHHDEYIVHHHHDLAAAHQWTGSPSSVPDLVVAGFIEPNTLHSTRGAGGRAPEGAAKRQVVDRGWIASDHGLRGIARQCLLDH